MNKNSNSLTRYMQANNIGVWPTIEASPINIVALCSASVLGFYATNRLTGNVSLSIVAGLISAGGLWAADRYWQYPKGNNGYHPLTNPPETQLVESVESDVSSLEAEMEDLLIERGFPAQVVGYSTSHRRIIYDVFLPRSFSIKNLIADALDLQRACKGRRVMIQPTVEGRSCISRVMLEKEGAQDAINITSIMNKENDFFNDADPMSLPLGQDLEGNTALAQLDKLPHLIVAGTTGSGKSVTVNCFIVWLMAKNAVEDLQFILIDPKRLEFAIYAKSRHLARPVITEMEGAKDAMEVVVNEMEYRYKCMEAAKVRDLETYNKKVSNTAIKNPMYGEYDEDAAPIMSTISEVLTPFAKLMVGVDEMSDLMLMFGEVELLIVRLAQKSRACGIHLLLCTQRPEVKVITGLIKANIPARYSLQVSTNADSRIVLDRGGAEKLLGNGDACFAPNQSSELLNVQSYFIDVDQIEEIVDQINLKKWR